MADELEVEDLEEAPSVLPIDRKSVHQICSGQVVLNLATAVKELVENSLDAGATSVDVKLKENGADLVEVSDNGSGVQPQNFEALTLKYYTSKLRDFSDLSSVETFGFRGEALSSLCALSDLSITTRHTAELVGTKLEYDHNGKLKSKIPCAREYGTTVILLNLFSTLPVRHKEFLRNIKKEFVKLVHVLQGYCLISNGVRVTCFNQMEKGRKMTVVCTHGSAQLKDNITCVFGPKQVQSLELFKQVQPSEEDCNEFNINSSNVSNHKNPFQVTGYVSKADHGMGRSSADRQFLFINKRPCDLTKVTRVVNEVYHMFNRHQCPFVLLDISLKRDAVDVNVTPDKRQVFMQEEKFLLATIRSSLKKMFDTGTSTYDVNQKPLTQIKLASSDTSVRNETCHGNTSQRSGCEIRSNGNEDVTRHAGLPRVFPSLGNFKRAFSAMSSNDDRKKEPVSKQAKLTTLVVSEEEIVNAIDVNLKHDDDSINPLNIEVKVGSSLGCTMEPVVTPTVNKMSSNVIAVNNTEMQEQLFTDTMTMKNPSDLNKNSECKEDTKDYGETSLPGEAASTISKDPHASIREKLQCIISKRKTIRVEFNMDRLKESTRSSLFTETQDRRKAEARLFREKISPENNSAAEVELTKNIKKDSFAKMKILGQFNLGFIITKIDNDLFVIDQHAADEKYNFEDQRRNTTLQTQRLIIPKKLVLTAVNECILVENLEIFRKNGFEFEIDENADAMQKIKLVSLPMSKNWTFGVEDVEELIFMLSDSPGVMCRPSRVRKMFASRACRMSVMVGTALSHTQMKRIVGHMGMMDHPWNCPHGRPTMRHVINLGMVPSNTD